VQVAGPQLLPESAVIKSRTATRMIDGNSLHHQAGRVCPLEVMNQIPQSSPFPLLLSLPTPFLSSGVPNSFPSLLIQSGIWKSTVSFARGSWRSRTAKRFLVCFMPKLEHFQIAIFDIFSALIITAL